MLQVLPGRHCMFCHKDYKEIGEDHTCQKKAKNLLKAGNWKLPTPCTDKCSLKYSIKSNTIEGKLDYIIQLLERPKP